MDVGAVVLGTRWAARAPIAMFKAHLGFVFAGRLLLLPSLTPQLRLWLKNPEDQELSSHAVWLNYILVQSGMYGAPGQAIWEMAVGGSIGKRLVTRSIPDWR